MLISKTTIQKGNGVFTPPLGSSCRIKVKCDETTFQGLGFQGITASDTSEITLGEWDAAGDGIVHSCVQDMVVGEVCEVQVNVDKNNLELNSNETGTRRNCGENPKTLALEVTLCSFAKGKEIWEMSMGERLDTAFHHKSKGIDLYKNADILGAFRRFSAAGKYLISMGKEKEIDVTLRTKWKTLSTQVYLNLAACQLHQENHEAVVENCSKALTYDENNVKGYFRRAQSRNKLNDLDNAKKDLLYAQKLEPSNTAVEKLLKDVESRLHKRNSKMANAMKKMFSS